MTAQPNAATIEQWDIFELSLDGPAGGNPFLDVTLAGEFTYQHRTIHADGFYDGDGVYRVRFMPDTPGAWRYVTRSNRAELDGIEGEFTCVEADAGNHGPVRVRDTYHFAYADGTPYIQIGTTCYVWNHQGDELEEQTLATLRDASFNKMRMCVFPKDYVFNRNEPPYYPFEGAPPSGDAQRRTLRLDWGFTRFNPEFFRHLEQRVGDLRDLGIEADIILFHPYDRWGFAEMDAETDDRYLRYVVARLAAYRNVWWSMANEFDLMRAKSMADWDRFFRVVQESDPYQHLRSVHNCRGFYDHARPWVTHASIQHSDLARVAEWRASYGKPVVVDECCYEGNIQNGWGNISAQEMVHRFWLGAIGGGYVGHGETYLHPEDILWWSKGGVLHGDSPARIAFLKEILEQNLTQGLTPHPEGARRFVATQEDGYTLYYFGVHQPAVWALNLPDDTEHTVEVIDTWAMTVTPLEGTFKGQCTVDLPGKPYHALQIRPVAQT